MRRFMLWGILALVVGAGLIAWPFLGGRMAQVVGWRSSPYSSQGLLETLGGYGEVPDFSLIERSGRRVTRADLLGRVWIANFIYTKCKETCPLQSAVIARLQGEFAGEEGLRLVSITVDSAHDTPAVLTRYAERYGADPVRWLFLTGEKRAIYDLASDGFRLGVVDPDDRAQAEERLGLIGPAPAFATHGSKGLVIHSSRFVLVDRQARIRAYHLPDDEQSLARLRQNVGILLREKPKER
ncbi:MAG: SCO family protein [Candidatus Rokubacteria bacterium]|nr:SCO family protein [Candidatus Rokubacteria bacterium]